MDPCRIFAGNASKRLARAICDKLEVPLGDADVSRFEDGEVSVRFNDRRRSDLMMAAMVSNKLANEYTKKAKTHKITARPSKPAHGNALPRSAAARVRSSLSTDTAAMAPLQCLRWPATSIASAFKCYWRLHDTIVVN